MDGEFEITDSDAIDLRNFFGIVRRQGRIIIVVAATVIVLALVYLFAAVPQYRATALISIQPNREALADTSNSPNNAAAISAVVDGEVEILRSTDLILAVVREQNLLADPEFGLRPSRLDLLRSMLGLELSGPVNAEKAVYGVVMRLQDAITVRRKGLTYLIEVSVTSEDPAKAAALANALTDTYIRRQIQHKVDMTLVARDVLQQRVDKARVELETVEGSVDQFINDYVGDFVRQTGREDLQILQSDLQAKADQIANYEARIEQNRALVQSRSWDDVNSALLSDAMRQLLAQRKALNNRLAEDQSKGLDISELEKALGVIDEELQAKAGEDISATRRTVSDLTAQRNRMRDELRQSVMTADLPSGTLADLYQLQQEGQIARTQYQDLLGRLRQLDTLATIQLADATVVSQALAPKNPSFPNKQLVLSLALVLGIGLGFGVALLNEFLVGGFTSEDQVRSGLKNNNVLTIPIARGGDAGKLKSIADLAISERLCPFSESLRQIKKAVDKAGRTLPRESGLGTIVLLTSAVPGEGKTTTSLGLARTLAEGGHRTCLIDLDLRKPSLAEQLGMKRSEDLLEFLAGNLTISDLRIVKEDVTGLHIIAGGARAHVPTDTLLGSPRLGKLLEALRADFDYVIIDSSPVLPVVDTLYLAKYADVLVNLVRFASTNQSDVRNAVRRLTEEARKGTPCIQVLSMEEMQRGRYYRYSGYYSGYSYRSDK